MPKLTPKQRFFAEKEAEALAAYQEIMSQAQAEWNERIKARKQERKIDKTCRTLSQEKPSRKTRLVNWIFGLSKPLKPLYPQTLAVWSEQ